MTTLKLPQLKTDTALFCPVQSLDKLEISRHLEGQERSAKASGAQVIVGPVQGDTWHSYRCVLTDSGASPFFLEPFRGENDNYRELSEVLAARGYRVIARFLSTSIPAGATDSGARAIDQIAPGLTVTAFDSQDFMGQLEDIYRLSILAFKDNYLYKPITFEKFVDLYRPLQSLIKSELVTMVYDGQELVGLSLSLPDFNETDKIRFILKTLVRHPAKKYSGLGRALVQESVNVAARQGFEQVIFALYKADGSSAYIADFYPTTVVRTYGLYARDLAGEGNI